MFDDLTTTQAELIGHVRAACQAIKFLRNVEPLECLPSKEHYEEWSRHMNALNTARTRLGMAAEYLHSDLNSFNDAVISAKKSGEERGIIIDYGDDAYDPDQLE
ncbi:hypothetical protein KSZ_62090 [Dictyobacter formicarum]|uniref:Uncharacterized protein n=2 Tax=Dictyobacter formicarum TaxID=2778368 RepID=A0ABQ3VS38_9CHLR|nr:hypothetical protein KSZ_62090 [Dictyobacter formicarum]